MSDDAATLATRLLDAQVDWVIEQVSGAGLAALVARDVTEAFEIAATVPLAEALDADAVRIALLELLDAIGGGALLTELLTTVADAVYDSDAGDEILLSEVVPRDSVAAAMSQVLAMQATQDRVMDQLARSPLVAGIASRYVSKIVTDFLQQNREQAEKLPGMSSLLSLGMGAASRMRTATDRTFGGLIGEAQNRSTQYAIRRTNGAMRELLREAPVQDAAMEVWDLQAAEPVSALREYVTAQDMRDLLQLLTPGVAASERGEEFVGALLDDCVAAVFERYGDRDVASLLGDLGITRDVVVEIVTRLAPPVVESALADGRLRDAVRTRLEPFYRSPATLALLDETAPSITTNKRPRPKSG